MNRLTLLDKLLAFVPVFAMAMAGLLPFLRPVFREWKRTMCSSSLRAFCAAVSLLVLVYVGGSLDKQSAGNPLIQEILLGPNVVELLRDAPPSPPLWYQDLGYPTTDTDGDGIPDYWERRTHTQRLVSDADADYDHDGVDNVEEFLHQCDPQTKDTDGDGLTDREEIDGTALGLTGFDPLTPCEYPADTSDAEAWGTGWWPVRFGGLTADGFPWGVGYPDAADDNVDVLVTVDSSRYAVLSWEDGFGPKELLLPPCTNLPLRLRVPTMESSSVSLSAAAGAMGLWKAALRSEWDARRGQPIERNRIQVADGAFVDMENLPGIFTGVLPGTFDTANEPMRGAGPTRDVVGTNPASIRGLFTRKSIELKSGSGFCLLHGPSLVVTAACENVSLPLEWGVEGRGTVSCDSYVFIPEDYGWQADEMRISCAKRDGKKNLVLQAEETYRAVPCGRPQTNFVGACWLSSHNPTNAEDHLPRIYEEVVRYFPNCPPTTNTVAVLGWTHNELVLWIRNLVRIVTGDPWDDETDHCIAVQFHREGTIDLLDYLADVCTPYQDNLVFSVNGRPLSGHIIDMQDHATENDLKPEVLQVSFSIGETRELDRLWIVIYANKLETDYETWKTTFASTAWTSALPAVPSSIRLSTNSSGRVSVDTSKTYPGWKSPDDISSYLHHDAVYEMRSESVGIHGHQATYRGDGSLIRTTIAAGTADYNHPLSFGMSWGNGVVERHYVNDVIPFLRAISLDGNPGVYNGRYIPKTLTRPCLYQGTNLNDYISRRPTLPTGTIP